jgi:chemotaxis methyl-accepting protein methylase
MQVHKTQTFTPTHKAWRREVLQYTSCGKQVVSHRNDTSFFRNNDFWEDLVSFITEKFKNSDKVNVYDYACSNGSEAYTFLMQLYSSSDSATVDKFTPITAKDSDPEAIKMAKSGILPIQGYEVEKIQEYTRGKLEEFFDVAKGFKIKSREMTEIPLKKHYADKIDHLTIV